MILTWAPLPSEGRVDSERLAFCRAQQEWQGSFCYCCAQVSAETTLPLRETIHSHAFTYSRSLVHSYSAFVVAKASTTPLAAPLLEIIAEVSALLEITQRLSEPD